MKTILSLLLLLTVPAFAQVKAWTWTAPALPGEFKGTGIISSSVDAAGNAAFVLGEYAEDEGKPLVKRTRFLWISSKGVVLHDSVEDSNLPYWVLFAEEKAWGNQPKWAVLHVSASKLAITDGKRVFVGRVKGKSATVTLSPQFNDGTVTPIAAPPAFKGWLEEKGPTVQFLYNEQAYFGDHAEGDVVAIESISLWRF